MDRELNDWAAETLLGRKRGDCQGIHGWASVGNDGIFDSGTWCDRCGKEYVAPGPCPAYPFAAVMLQEVMQALGERGLHVFVRYDPDRKRLKWTVMIEGDGRRDTDDPLETLVEMAARRVDAAIKRV